MNSEALQKNSVLVLLALAKNKTHLLHLLKQVAKSKINQQITTETQAAFNLLTGSHAWMSLADVKRL